LRRIRGSHGGEESVVGAIIVVHDERIQALSRNSWEEVEVRSKVQLVI
jgi:hypothetical protein